MLLKAFSTATQRRDDVGLVLVGDGPQATKYRRLADALGIPNAYGSYEAYDPGGPIPGSEGDG